MRNRAHARRRNFGAALSKHKQSTNDDESMPSADNDVEMTRRVISTSKRTEAMPGIVVASMRRAHDQGKASARPMLAEREAATRPARHMDESQINSVKKLLKIGRVCDIVYFA